MNWLTVIKYGPYVVAALIIGALAVTVKLERDKADDAIAGKATAEANLVTALDINKQQQYTIAKMQEQRAIDDRLVTSLNNSLTAIQDAADKQTQAINDLKAVDPDAKSFLATPLPDSVRGLYGLKPRSGASPASGNASPAR